MTYKLAKSIFYNIDCKQFTEEEKLQAVEIICNSTPWEVNVITKDMMFAAIKWLAMRVRRTCP